MYEFSIIMLIVIGVILLLAQRWFWILVFGLGGLACIFSMIASVFHFQILMAIGFFVLTIICGAILETLIEGAE